MWTQRDCRCQLHIAPLAHVWMKGSEGPLCLLGLVALNTKDRVRRQLGLFRSEAYSCGGFLERTWLGSHVVLYGLSTGNGKAKR